MKTMIVGDYHAQIKNLSECEALMEFIVKKAKEHKAKRIVFLGDLLHHHSIVRIEIQNFWLKWLYTLSFHFKVVAIRGNHDQSTHQSNAQSALMVFKDLHKNLTIVEDVVVDKNEAFVAYVHTQAEFEEKLKLVPDNVDTLWIHQTVDGSKYDGGFFAPDGFSMDLFKRFKRVVSGHIHVSDQKIGNVWYAGTPKWDTKSDANDNKGIWFVESDILNPTFISTEDVVTPIRQVTYREGFDAPEIPSGIVYLELEGTGAWIAKTAKKMKDKARIVAKPTDSVLKTMEKKQVLTDIEQFLTQNIADEVRRKELLDFLESA